RPAAARSTTAGSTWRRASRSPRRTSSADRLSLPFERDRSEERLGARSGILRIDRDGHRADVLLGRFAIDSRVILEDVTGLRQPSVELSLARADHHEGHVADLLTGKDRAGGRRRVPDIADDPRA